MNPEEIKVVEKWKAPNIVNQLQKFLGICRSYRRFVKDYSKIAALLLNLG